MIMPPSPPSKTFGYPHALTLLHRILALTLEARVHIRQLADASRHQTSLLHLMQEIGLRQVAINVAVDEFLSFTGFSGDHDSAEESSTLLDRIFRTAQELYDRRMARRHTRHLHVRVYFALHGGHVTARVFSGMATGPKTTLGLSGTLTFREEEWESVQTGWRTLGWSLLPEDPLPGLHYEIP